MLIALGANLQSEAGGPASALHFALSRLPEMGHPIRSVSRFFRTPCFPAGAGPDYVNAAALLETGASPRALLDDLHAIEAERGRERVQRWGMRTLDLDLLAAGGAVLPDLGTFERWRDLDPALQRAAAPDQIVLPHPRLQDRAFVLVPLAEVAPAWRHPVSDLTVTEMLAALDPAEVAAVVPLEEGGND